MWTQGGELPPALSSMLFPMKVNCNTADTVHSLRSPSQGILSRPKSLQEKWLTHSQSMQVEKSVFQQFQLRLGEARKNAGR